MHFPETRLLAHRRPTDRGQIEMASYYLLEFSARETSQKIDPHTRMPAR